jgi:hypothetical protein
MLKLVDVIDGDIVVLVGGEGREVSTSPMP